MSAHVTLPTRVRAWAAERSIGIPLMNALTAVTIMSGFILSASTWFAIARLSGWAWYTAPAYIGLTDSFVGAALVLWLSPVQSDVARVAKRNTVLIALIGIAAQSGYHGFLIFQTGAPRWQWVLAGVAGLLPPLLLALVIHMRALLTRSLADQAAEVERSARSLADRLSAQADWNAHERSEVERANAERSWTDQALALTDAPLSDSEALIGLERVTERERITERVTGERSAGYLSAREDLMSAIEGGEPPTGEVVARQYGVSPATGRRWLSLARTDLASEQGERS